MSSAKDALISWCSGAVHRTDDALVAKTVSNCIKHDLDLILTFIQKIKKGIHGEKGKQGGKSR